MKSLYHFFRLIRPLNLAVIALTMGVFQIFIWKYQVTGAPNYSDWSVYVPEDGGAVTFFNWPIWNFDFILLLLSTLLIASAGNIINDYFDLKADRVNKPDRLIIDVHIKRRVAILWNWIFNSFGLLIALYLSWKYSNWLIAFISLASINLLWFYSAIFKRKFLIGNMMVAFLTAIVPIYVLVFYFPLRDITLAAHDYFISLPPQLIVAPTLAMAAIAFSINLIREIIKDIADVKGDLLLKAQTIPIRWGIKKAKWVLFFLLIPLLLSLFFYLVFCFELDFYLKGGSIGFPNGFIPQDNSGSYFYFTICAILVLLLIISSYVVLILSNKRTYYLLSSNLLKLAMLFGLLTPLFL